jgi:hypothetical protein
VSVLAIVADHDCHVSVDYLSIAHYLIHGRYSYVTIEAAVRPSADCNAISLVLDGVLPGRKMLWWLQETWNFRELRDISQLTLRANAAGVWDFRDTFFHPDLRTNRGYEGPPEWRALNTIRDDQTIEMLGQEARIPHFGSTDVTRRGNLSLLRLGQSVLAANELSAIRVGFFLRRRTLKRQSLPFAIAERLLSHRPKTSFVTRVYTYSVDDEPDLDKLGVRRRLDASTLALTLAPFVKRVEGAAKDYADEVSSDLWIVGYARASVALQTPEAPPEEPTSRATFGLFTQEREYHSSPFWDVHFRFGRNVPEWRGLDTTEPVKDFRYQIRWEAELPGLTLRNASQMLWPIVALTGLGLALSANNILATSAADVVLAAVGLYVALLVILAARMYVPPVRRFFEGIQRPNS